MAKRPKLTRGAACAILTAVGDADFHALSSAKVDDLLKAADHYGYRKPKSANGSRGRYFYSRVQRLCR